jgi:LCP family protein required for cell wall assembly
VLRHLDDPIPHELPPTFRDDVLRRAFQLRRRRRVTASAAVVALVVLGVAGASLAWVAKRDQDIQRVQLAPGVLAEEVPSTPVDIVLVGTDAVGNFPTDAQPPYEGGRADAVMLVRLDAANGTLRILSFPRDLVDPRTGGRLTDTLLGHDPAAVVDSVHLMIPIPIHHYIALDFQGFAALVDELGGVDLNLSAVVSDAQTGLALPAGCSHVSGMNALALVRARHLVVNGVEDPSADLGRTQRQQAFVTAVFGRLHELATDPLALDRYARILADHAVLDDKLDLGHLIELGRQFRNIDPAKVAALTLPSTPISINGAALLESTSSGRDIARQFLFGDDSSAPTGDPTTVPVTISAC